MPAKMTAQTTMGRVLLRTIYVLLLALILLSACQNIGEDVPGTLAAGDDLLVTEAANLDNVAATRIANARATIVVDETRLAELQSSNDQLLLTLAAGSTPTIALIVGQADIRQEELMSDDGNLNRLFAQTGMATAVSAQNGCVINPVFSFSSTELDVLYATAQVLNATGSLDMRVEWYLNNQIIHEDAFIMTPNTTPYCFWFDLNRGDTDFPPGSWTVRMYLEQFPLRDLTMSFEITE